MLRCVVANRRHHRLVRCHRDGVSDLPRRKIHALEVCWIIVACRHGRGLGTRHQQQCQPNHSECLMFFHSLLSSLGHPVISGWIKHWKNYPNKKSSNAPNEGSPSLEKLNLHQPHYCQNTSGYQIPRPKQIRKVSANTPIVCIVAVEEGVPHQKHDEPKHSVCLERNKEQSQPSLT